MMLIENWRNTLRHAWSVHLAALSALLGVLDQLCDVAAQLQDVLPQVQPFVPAHLFGLLSTACAVAAIAARVVHQVKVHP